mmetsp:Transcript_3703/g.8718  ORF Transcript_3703/g.8718 Transcript_3703/m.8718 type:complete len:267 (-) Transcript_3703:1114-1914(-)
MDRVRGASRPVEEVLDEVEGNERRESEEASPRGDRSVLHGAPAHQKVGPVRAQNGVHAAARPHHDLHRVTPPGEKSPADDSDLVEQQEPACAVDSFDGDAEEDLDQHVEEEMVGAEVHELVARKTPVLALSVDQVSAVGPEANGLEVELCVPGDPFGQADFARRRVRCVGRHVVQKVQHLRGREGQDSVGEGRRKLGVVVNDQRSLGHPGEDEAALGEEGFTAVPRLLIHPEGTVHVGDVVQVSLPTALPLPVLRLGLSVPFEDDA